MSCSAPSQSSLTTRTGPGAAATAWSKPTTSTSTEVPGTSAVVEASHEALWPPHKIVRPSDLATPAALTTDRTPFASRFLVRYRNASGFGSYTTTVARGNWRASTSAAVPTCPPMSSTTPPGSTSKDRRSSRR